MNKLISFSTIICDNKSGIRRLFIGLSKKSPDHSDAFHELYSNRLQLLGFGSAHSRRLHVLYECVICSSSR